MTGLSRAPTGRSALVAQIDLRGPHRRSALRSRIAAVIDTLTAEPTGDLGTGALLDRFETALQAASHEQIWLALSVVTARLPDQDTVLRAVRLARLDGPLAALAEAITFPPFPPVVPGREWPAVRIITDRVVVDLHDTAATELATGIQRVARQTASRWYRDHDLTLIGWTKRYLALHELSAEQQHRALGYPPSRRSEPVAAECIVPWQCQYLLPELISEPQRNRKLQSLFRFSGNVGATIGFDLVPLTSAETTAEGMGQGFSTALAATAHAARVATISGAAANEYEGWRDMLGGAGLSGPAIRAISLATEANEPSEQAIAQARSELLTDGLPMVLAVGSHEPRKNHLAVLHAAELLWRDGHTFSLVFVGGNAWRGERFTTHVERLQEAGRPILSVRALPDDLLWAAYHLAYCLIFPSLNEGFGLPIAEALSSGTPVVTSRFGSMEEIAGAGGAILVDPRDDHDIAAGLGRLLSDSGLRERLAEQARALPARTWDDYASDTWQYLTGSLGASPVGAGAR